MSYADDAMAFLSDPEHSLLVLMDLITEFRELSGYHMNRNKSHVLSLGGPVSPNFVKNGHLILMLNLLNILEFIFKDLFK